MGRKSAGCLGQGPAHHRGPVVATAGARAGPGSGRCPAWRPRLLGLCCHTGYGPRAARLSCPTTRVPLCFQLPVFSQAPARCCLAWRPVADLPAASSATPAAGWSDRWGQAGGGSPEQQLRQPRVCRWSSENVAPGAAMALCVGLCPALTGPSVHRVALPQSPGGQPGPADFHRASEPLVCGYEARA